MIVFAIPMRAKGTSRNWKETEKRFNDTLKSIFNQKGCTNFRVIVACNDIPNIDCKYDERLEFIKVDIPVPKSWIEMSRDKFWKLTIIAVRIREILEQEKNPENGIYVMPVDADDYVNCHIAEYCEKNPNKNGFISKSGYVWSEGKKYFVRYKNMHTYCGSCNIIKMYIEDLPSRIPFDDTMCHDKEVASILNERYPIRYNHNEVVEKYTQAGKAFSELPFASTVYVVGHTDNISSLYCAEYDKKDVKRFHPVAFLRKINPFDKKFISKRIKQEFGIG